MKCPSNIASSKYGYVISYINVSFVNECDIGKDVRSILKKNLSKIEVSFFFLCCSVIFTKVFKDQRSEDASYSLSIYTQEKNNNKRGKLRQTILKLNMLNELSFLFGFSTGLKNLVTVLTNMSNIVSTTEIKGESANTIILFSTCRILISEIRQLPY